jgi:hypothetical protein
MGLKVSSMAHSYGVAYAEDILFVTVKVRNESGEFTAFEKDKDGNIVWVRDVEGKIITGNAMEMPDGTEINKGDGFDYKELYLGFYMDADVLSHDINGSIYPHTNPDDFMKYIDCKVSEEYFPDGCEIVNNDTLRISMAVIGDWDGQSPAGIEGFSMKTGESLGPDFGLVAIQLLDSPYATKPKSGPRLSPVFILKPSIPAGLCPSQSPITAMLILNVSLFTISHPSGYKSDETLQSIYFIKSSGFV